jgi:conjugative transposon TraK protein
MFRQFRNIDTAFQFIRLFSIVFLIANVVICLYTVRRSTSIMQKGQEKIYVLYNSKLLDAVSIERKDSLAVEIRDHVKMFHYYFYTLQPDEEVNHRHIASAMYLADSSAYSEYKNLEESGYYSKVISANISQEVLDYDSISVDISRIPYHFIYYGKIRLSRATSILTRSIVTEGYIRNSGISDKNPHGFLIEHWKVDDNRNLSLEKK